jgi:CHAT domain-containing protein
MRKSFFIFVVSITIVSSFFLTPLFGQDEGIEDRISGLLDPETAVLIYDVKNSKVDVITANGILTRELKVYDEPIEIKVGFLKDSVEATDTISPFQDEAHILYTILISPVTEDLLGITRLGIVPSPELYELPFSALVSKKDTQNTFMPRPRFVVDDFSVFYAPTIELMEQALSSETSSNIGGIVIGNSQYPASFPQLKVAPIEMKDVAESVPGSIMLEKDKATEIDLKNELNKGGIHLVHMTTHSVIKPGSDSASKLLFTGGGGEDGNLTVSEVIGMSLDADLVTISADSAGIVWGGSGGFPGAFLVSGAKSVIAPVWKIDRGVTAMLFDFFYDNLNSCDKAEALRLAQVMVIDLEKERGYRRLAHPGFWAPFLLYGGYK